MLRFTHGYGVLREQTGQENKNKPAEIINKRRNSYEKSAFP